MASTASMEIFVPYWGDPQLLYATIDSVRAQTDPDWTLVVVDDNYPDPSVAQYFSAETDARVRYVRNETNLGIIGNFSRCLHLASDELMMFLGCDDLLHPDFVANVRAAHASYPDASIIEVGVRVIDERGQPVAPLGDRVKHLLRPKVAGRVELGGESLAVSLLRGDWLYWPSLVFRTDRINKYEFRDDLPIILDLALIMDMVVAGETMVLDPVVCFSYRRHTSSLSSSSLLEGSRLPDEQRYYADIAAQLRALGWHRAARTARLRWTSRLHALTLVPRAVRSGAGLGPLLTHAFRD
jgi:glycosyltransferase involved in cell wall biosynthesis